MTPDKDLFNLVNSLDSNEKRYAKLMLSLQGGESNYKHLFNSIAKQKEYNEETLRKKFKCQIKDFPSTKRNLYQLVLRALRLYHARSSSEIQIYEMLQNIEVLFRKGLYHECKKMIKKAEQEIIMSNNTLSHLALLNEEIRVTRRLDYENIPDDYFDKLLKKQNSLLQDYHSIVNVKYAHDNFMRLHLKSGAAQSSSIKKKLYSFIDEKNLLRKSLPVNAKIYSYLALSQYYLSKKQYLKSSQYSERLLKLFESLPRLSAEQQTQYANQHIMIAISLLKSKKYEECFATIKKLKDLEIKDEQIASNIFYFSIVVEFTTLNNLGEFEKSAELINETVNGLKKYQRRISNNRYLAICYCVAYTYFGNKKYSNAMEWIKKILNDVKIDMRIDFYSCAYLLWIMCHIEKGNYDTAVYLSKSKPEFRTKNESLFKIESMFLNFVTKELSKNYSSKQIRESFKELKMQIEKLLAIPHENKILDYIDFPAWIESKIENKSFAEMVRSRHRTHAE